LSLRYYTLDVFTRQRFGGNGLAVVLEADGLAQGLMQKIAREFNLSETVFIQRPTRDGALVRARIFTPEQELPFAGHPTVGTACLLAELGIAPAGDDVSFLLDEGIGPVPVRVRREADGAIYGELSVAQLPQFGPPPPDRAVLAALLGLEPADIGYRDEAPRAVSCGLAFILIPLRVPELLAGVSIDTAAFRRTFSGAWASQVLLYARGYEGELRVRMFAPLLGVSEDPATGSAAAALAGRLADEHSRDEGRLQWTIHQGLEMGRPSVLYAEADKRANKVSAVRVGGHCVRVSEGVLHVD
jgi:trans-2,3-dihydro-3-hydroxyanthranilate isomerase